MSQHKSSAALRGVEAPAHPAAPSGLWPGFTVNSSTTWHILSRACLKSSRQKMEEEPQTDRYITEVHFHGLHKLEGKV